VTSSAAMAGSAGGATRHTAPLAGIARRRRHTMPDALPASGGAAPRIRSWRARSGGWDDRALTDEGHTLTPCGRRVGPFAAAIRLSRRASPSDGS
jgi:hypothetical protein